MTRSPARARLNPPPAATPLTALITGLGLRTRRDTAPCRYVVSSLTSAPIRGRLSAKSFTSPPAQNALPAPVMTTQRTLGSSSTSSAAWKSSRPSARLSALSASGRLSVIVATPSRRWRSSDSKFIDRSSVFIGSSRTAGSITDSPRLRLRLALRPRDVLRLARPRSGSPDAAPRHLRGHVQDLLDPERFHQDEVHAVRATLLRRELHAEARHHDDGHGGCHLLDRPRDLPPRHARHREVGEDDIERLGAEAGDGLAAVGRDDGAMPA